MSDATVDAPVEYAPPLFERFVRLGTVALVCFTVVGLGLAVAGWFRPVPVAVGTLVATIIAARWVGHAGSDDPPGTRPHRILTVAVLLLAAASGIWNGIHHGEHLIAERDPGVYAATGLWLAEHGTLRVQPPEGPFRDAPGVRQYGIGFTPNGAGSLDAQFAHSNATFLAVGAWIDPLRLFLVPQILMAGALVLLHALGVRLGKPVAGAFAAITTAVSYPFVYVARDTYSEPLALVLLLAGLWALTFVRSGGVRAGVLAGALLGATCLARIDGFIPLIPLAAVIAFEYTTARRADDDERRRGFAAVYITMAIFAAAGALEVRMYSNAYYESNLGPRLPGMVGGILVATAAGVFVGRWLFRTGPDGDAPRAILRWAFAGTVAALTGFVVWARFLRPDFDALRAAIDEATQTVQLLPLAKSISYLWLEWYLGPFLVAGGFAALAWMIGRGFLDGERDWLPAAGVGLVTTLLYLVSPSITPDHPWAMRRFVAVGIPLLLLAAAMGLEAVGRRRPPWTAIGAGIVGVALLVTPIRVTTRLADTSVGTALATRFNRICTVAHREPSAILVTPGQGLGYTIPVALQSWCDVPVAGAIGGVTPGEIHELSLLWHAQGRRLLILSTSPDGLVGVGGTATGIPGPVLVAPESSVTHAPDRLGPDSRMAQSPDGVLPLFLVEAASSDT